MQPNFDMSIDNMKFNREIKSFTLFKKFSVNKGKICGLTFHHMVKKKSPRRF